MIFLSDISNKLAKMYNADIPNLIDLICMMNIFNF